MLVLLATLMACVPTPQLLGTSEQLVSSPFVPCHPFLSYAERGERTRK